MSRPGSPEPQYDHPNAPNVAGPFFYTPVEMVYMYEIPLAASGWHPEHLGTLLANLDFRPSVTAEINRYVGWLLELLLLPAHQSVQLRRQLGVWQRSLQGRCGRVRLEWFQAMAVYGLELRQD